MRKVIVISIVAFAFMVLGFSNIASASCGMCKAEPFEKGEVINDTCPVMGGEVDKNTPYKTEYKAVKFNKDENQTTSQEIVKIYNKNKLIKNIKSPTCIQKWWYPEELKKILEENGFKIIKVLNPKGKIFDKKSEEFIIIAKL